MPVARYAKRVKPVGTLVLKRLTTVLNLRGVLVMDEDYKIVEETYTLLDESSRLKKQWYASKESIESAKQMRITAQGYIHAMEAT